MLMNTENDVFLHVPSQSKSRLLHPCHIQEMPLDRINLQCRENFFAVDVGMKAVLYFHDSKGHFYKQNARVDECLAPPPGQVIGIVVVDDPVSAESRQHYRVSTVLTDMFVDLGEEYRCQMLDISTVGLAVISTMEYPLGEVLPVRVIFDNVLYQGNIALQSIRPLDTDRFRYGFHGLDEGARGDNLAKGLHIISMAVQRQQLRRRSGTNPRG